MHDSSGLWQLIFCNFYEQVPCFLTIAKASLGSVANDNVVECCHATFCDDTMLPILFHGWMRLVKASV